MKSMFIVVVVIGLVCCEATILPAILNCLLNPLQCLSKLKQDWFNTTRFPLIELIQSDLDFLTKLGTTSPDQPWNSTSGSGPRKECRTLSDDEWSRLAAAFNWLMTNKTSPLSPFTLNQVFASQHRSASAPCAHGGPCFPTWHRLFILRYERALQLYDNRTRLCYWDTSLDQPLPNAYDSAVWTPKYFGNNQGDVTTGFSANSSVPLALAECIISPTMKISRQNQGDNSYLYSPAIINALFTGVHSYTTLETPYTSNNFENVHGYPHVWIGGQMAIISCSPLDGMFWMHHTYIDYLYDLFRQQQTTNKETDYPTDSDVPSDHHFNDPMKPFSDIVCGGGLSNNIVPRLYNYAPSPYACTTHADCNSKILWCNSGTGKCTACVREGGQMGSNWPDRGCYIEGCATPKRAIGTNVCTCSP
jgi:tyrosinase